MTSRDDYSIPRTFSNIDDGLNMLLAELKQEDGGLQGREGNMPMMSLTPFLKMGPLDAEAAGGRLVTTPAAITGLLAGPLLATASSYTVLKGAGSAATPLVLPNRFIPVPAAPNKPLGGKLRPGGGAPPLLLHQTSGHGGFTIPAYGRPFTQLDFISTDDLDDSTAPSGGMLCRGGSIAGPGSLADFGELADESRLGELPTEEDLRLLLFDPASLQSMPGHSWSAARATMLMQQPQPAPALQHACSYSSSEQVALVDASAVEGSMPPRSDAVTRTTTVLRIRTGAGAPGGSRTAPAGDGVTALGSPKRRADRMDVDPRDGDSLRGSKRHSSGWSEESDSGGGDTPSSAAATGSILLPHAWFGVTSVGQPLQASGSGGSLQPTRFALESGQRPGGRSSGEGIADPAYTPAKERGRGAPRQQQQQYQQYQQGAEGEEEAPVVQQFRGVSRHRLTQRWEASLWLNGRQLYLGGFNSQEDAAHAYDLAALACKGPDAQINFSPEAYSQQLHEIAGFTRDEVVAYVRRRSSAFSRGKSRFRGVSGHNGRWEARIGSFNGRKNVSFGVFESEEGAARQYDRALILEKGRTAKTNFPIRDYDAEVADYEAHLLSTCGSTHGPAAQRQALSITLPRNREATADEKKRSAVIYADALMRALRQPVQQVQRGGGRA